MLEHVSPCHSDGLAPHVHPCRDPFDEGRCQVRGFNATGNAIQDVFIGQIIPAEESGESRLIRTGDLDI